MCENIVSRSSFAPLSVRGNEDSCCEPQGLRRDALLYPCFVPLKMAQDRSHSSSGYNERFGGNSLLDRKISTSGPSLVLSSRTNLRDDGRQAKKYERGDCRAWCRACRRSFSEACEVAVAERDGLHQTIFSLRELRILYKRLVQKAPCRRRWRKGVGEGAGNLPQHLVSPW